MKNITQESIKEIERGAGFKIDFMSKSLMIRKRIIVKNDVFDGEIGIDFPETIDGLISEIESMYSVYRNSIPSEISDRNRKSYFYALPYEELSDYDMVFGKEREIARFELESYILFAIISGKMKWDEEFFGNKFFWKSEKTPGLIIMRQWVTSEKFSTIH